MEIRYDGVRRNKLSLYEKCFKCIVRGPTDYGVEMRVISTIHCMNVLGSVHPMNEVQQENISHFI